MSTHAKSRLFTLNFTCTLCVGLSGVSPASAASHEVWSARAATDDQPDSALAKSTVFELAISHDCKQVGSVIQPGFLVGSDGVGVTSYNALHGATGATARFHGSDVEYKVTILTAQPSQDLALIKLTPPSGDSGGTLKHLLLAPGEVQNGQTVWTLRSLVVEDEAKAIPGLASVGTQNLRGWESNSPFESPRWIFANKHQDRNTSGCPLVDEQGRVVGINVWAWPAAELRPLGLTGKVVDDLLTKYRSEKVKGDNKNEPMPAISVAQAKSKYNDQRLIGSIFPRLAYPKGTGPLDEARAQAKALESTVICRTCSGRGEVDTKIIRDQGQKSFYVPKKERCSACNGSRFVDKDKLGPNCARAAHTICRVSPGCDGYEKMIDMLEESANQIQAVGGGTFVKRLNEFTRERIDLKRIKRGEAIMFVGSLSRDKVLTAWEKDVAVVNVPWDAKAGVLAIAPDDGGKLDGRNRALIVGVVTGFVTARQADQWIVLDRVVAVPMKGEVP